MNIKDVASTSFGASVPPSGSALCQVLKIASDKLLFTRFHSL